MRRSGRWRRVHDPEEWKGLGATAPASLLQSWAWGEAKAESGCEVARWITDGGADPAGVQLEVRRRSGLRIGWAPGAPVGPGAGGISTDDLDDLADGAGILLIVSPLGAPPGRAPTRRRGYLHGTALLDLTQGHAAVRRNFRGKWRKTLCTAEREGLEVRSGGVDAVVHLLDELSARKGFHMPYPAGFFRSLSKAFGTSFGCRLAYKDTEAVSCWIDITWGSTALYLAGATSPAGRSVNASYLLAWDAVLRLGARGVETLDLGGVDDANAGVAAFKRGMRGQELMYPGMYVCGSRLPARVARTAVSMKDRWTRAGDRGAGTGVAPGQ